MGEGINRVVLAGNVGVDPELRHTNNGTAVLNLRVCTNGRKKDSSGQWVDDPAWHTVTIWAKRAEAVNDLVGKGSPITVDGRLSYRSYEDRDGNKRTVAEVVAEKVVVGRGERGSDTRSGGRDGPLTAEDPWGSDEIPF